jgi:hypothetical protein
MKYLVLAFTLLVYTVTAGLSLHASDTLSEPFYIYRDSDPDIKWPYSPSGWMGDWSDLSLDEASTESPQAGKNCLKISYSAKSEQQKGWTGIFWQRPANNWGDKNAGLDLTGATVLKFWARGAQGGEVIEKFQVGGIRGRFSDSSQTILSSITLTSEWKEYTIMLTNKDLTSLIGGFAWATSKRSNPEGCVFYLDDIRFE